MNLASRRRNVNDVPSYPHVFDCRHSHTYISLPYTYCVALEVGACSGVTKEFLNTFSVYYCSEVDSVIESEIEARLHHRIIAQRYIILL